MKHEMKLQSKYYNYIKSGTKRIELRLYDEKRKNINIGDIITFYKEPELVERFDAKVIGLLRYNSFSNLLKDFNIELLADKNMSKEELLNTLGCFYTVDMQKKYGVLGIRIELI